MVSNVVNLLVVEGNWLLCVWGLGNGYPWQGPLLVAISVGLHVCFQEHWLRQLAFVGGMAAFGFLFDSLLATFGLIEFGPGVRWSPPAMVALWANLATAFPLSLRWLRRRLVLAALLGLLGGMAAYAGGARLGAAHIPNLAAVLSIGLLWAIVLPLVLWIHRCMFPVVSATGSANPPGDR